MAGSPLLPSPDTILLARREVHATVLLPAGLAGLCALRALLSVADGLQLVGGYAKLHQELLGRAVAPVAQAQVVLRRAALVAVAFHHYGPVREVRQDALERRGVAGQRVPRIRANITLVVVEEGIPHVGLQALLDSRSGSRRPRRWWRRSRHSHRGRTGGIVARAGGARRPGRWAP